MTYLVTYRNLQGQERETVVDASSNHDAGAQIADARDILNVTRLPSEGEVDAELLPLPTDDELEAMLEGDVGLKEFMDFQDSVTQAEKAMTGARRPASMRS